MLYEKPENTKINYFLGYVYGIASAFLGTLFTMFNAKYINKVESYAQKKQEMMAQAEDNEGGKENDFSEKVDDVQE